MLGYQLDHSRGGGWGFLMGRGEVGLPRECLHHLQRSPREGVPKGLPFPPPSPQEDESTSA